MSQTGLNFGIDIGLDLRPFLGVCWGILWNLRAEISRFDGREDTLGCEAVKVVND